MKRISFVRLCLLLSVCSLALFAHAQTSVLTQHNNLQRTGWYDHETTLTTTNVKSGSFGAVFSRAVDDQIYAQPLVMLNVNVPNIGTRNIVFVATVNNTVYAFDADSANRTAPYWQVSLTPNGTRPPKNRDMTGACGGFYNDFSGNMGIVGTPVIDSVTNTLYVVARSVDANKQFSQYLHALDIVTGAERPNSPILIAAQIAGTGDGNVNGIVYFDAQKQNQRGGLLLLNGNVYIPYSSHCDWGPYHGWILGYDKTTLQQTRIYNSTPNGYFGGIWMSGAAPSADEEGNIYAAVGNGAIGTGNNPNALINRSESALKLIPSGNTFTVGSFFSPSNISVLEAADLDFGVTQMMLLPNTDRVITSCKDGHIYVLDRNNMGKYNANTNKVVQDIDLGVNAHLRSSLSYYKGESNEWMYSWSENALLKAFPYNRNNGTFDLDNTISSGVQGPVGNNGALLSVSSNGSADSTAILWTSYAANGDANQSVRPGILRAFAANDVTKELWNSSQTSSDDVGKYAKFNNPTIVNGKVYLATFSNKLMVYGLINNNNNDICPTTNIALNKPAVASSLEAPQYLASAAFDGDGNTRWSSAYSDPQSIYVDLGKRYDVCEVVLKWEYAFGKDFKIELSDDAVTWTPYATITGNTDLQNSISLKASGRYVRMYGTARGTEYGYSLYEMEVYGKESASSCATPTGLSVSDVYENDANLHWNSNGANSFTVQYKTVSADNWTTTTTNINSLALTGLACGTDYLFEVGAKCSASPSDTSEFSSSSAFSTLPCNTNCSPLPTRWTTQDIGEVDIAGSACYNNDVFTLTGSGRDIWDVTDGFRYAYTTNRADFEIKARVVSMDNSNEWNKCGIMIRENLTPGSRHAFVGMTSGNGAIFQNRPIADDISYNTNSPSNIKAPFWIKLVKSGSVYTGFVSPNGNKWTQLGDAVDAGFGADSVPVYAGLAITSHDNSILSTATVDNYLLSGGGVLSSLISFTASLSLNHTVNLQWVVSSDEDVISYAVERSADNNTYQTINTIKADGGGAETYTTEDRFPAMGVNYYRIRIIHTDGSVSYSAVASVDFTGSRPPVLAPNPASRFVTIRQGTEAIRFVNLYDMSGRLVQRLTTSGSNGVITIPVSNLANSIYLLEMRTANTVYKEKLVVHN